MSFKNSFVKPTSDTPKIIAGDASLIQTKADVEIVSVTINWHIPVAEEAKQELAKRVMHQVTSFILDKGIAQPPRPQPL